MSEPEQSQPVNSTNNPETNVAPMKITCAGGCNHSNPGLWRTAMYVPFLLIVGGFVALGMYPGLAEYATPLIGNSGKYANSSATTNGFSSGTPCCHSQNSCPNPSAVLPVTSETNAVEVEMTASDAPGDALTAVNVVEAATVETPSVETN